MLMEPRPSQHGSLQRFTDPTLFAKKVLQFSASDRGRRAVEAQLCDLHVGFCLVEVPQRKHVRGAATWRPVLPL